MVALKIQSAFVAMGLVLSVASMASVAAVPTNAKKLYADLFGNGNIKSFTGETSPWLQQPSEVAIKFAEECINATKVFLDHPEQNDNRLQALSKTIQPCTQDDIKGFVDNPDPMTGSKCAYRRHKDLAKKNESDTLEGDVRKKKLQFQAEQPPNMAIYHTEDICKVGAPASTFAAVARCVFTNTKQQVISDEDADKLDWRHPTKYEAAEPFASYMVDVKAADMRDAVARLAMSCPYTYCVSSANEIGASHNELVTRSESKPVDLRRFVETFQGQ